MHTREYSLALPPIAKKSLESLLFAPLQDVVPQDLVRETRRQINIQRSMSGPQRKNSPQRPAGGDNNQANVSAAVAAMFNDTDVKPLLESGFGTNIPLQKGGQTAVLTPSNSSTDLSESGYSQQDIPYYQWQGHLDGLWNGSKGSLPGRNR
jgi:hypothetical protein